MPTSRVLLVDDAPEVHVVIADILRRDAVEVDAVEDGEAALERAEAVVPTVVLLDIKLPGQSGIEVLPRLRERLPAGTPIIMLTACSDVDTAIHAIRLGAYDYVIKPFAHEDLREKVMRAVEQQTMRAELDGRRIGVGAGDLREQMGRSPHILRIIGHVQRVAVSNFTVLVQGETGTGKELVARAIHQNSPRHAQPFVALDCGAIPETLIESELFGYERGAFTGADRHKDGHFHLAEGGTLFLDEIVNLPPTTQVKLLRVLEERRVWALGSKQSVPVDVRIIAACNVDMETEVRAGRFRADLFYRLNEFSVNLPPLRERREDIAHLAKRFLEEAAIELKRTVYGFTPEAEAFLVGQPWPGNVRELRNVVRRAVLSAPTMIDLCHFAPLESPHAAGLLPRDGEATAATLATAREQAVVKAESEAIRAALIATGGNKAAAARLLKVDYKTLWYKLKEYGIRTFHAA